jgi:hypothetical protein
MQREGCCDEGGGDVNADNKYVNTDEVKVDANGGEGRGDRDVDDGEDNNVDDKEDDYYGDGDIVVNVADDGVGGNGDGSHKNDECCRRGGRKVTV